MPLHIRPGFRPRPPPRPPAPPPPTHQLQALVQSTSATGSAPLVVSFTGGAQGGHPPYSYSWNFGDGSPISTVQNPTHIFGSSGSYDVVLTVTDAGGNHAVSSTLVQIGGGTSMSPLALGLLTGGLGFAAGVAAMGGRSEERRVGEEGRSRWSPD